jgi:pimeloyl-ACP methyl ester carboxylesterase
MRYLLIIFSILIASISGLTQPRQGFVAVNQGKLFYEISGNGPTLLFLHGVCLDHRMWENQVNYFSTSYTCINVDLRGFGSSSVPDTTPV